MKNDLKEKDEKERTREKEEKRKSSSSSSARSARRYLDDEKANEYFLELAKSKNIDVEKDNDSMGNNPRRLPNDWTREMRDWFSYIKGYCQRKRIAKFSISTIKAWVAYANDVDFRFRDETPFSKNNFIRSLRMFKYSENRAAFDRQKEIDAAEKLIAKKARNAEREQANKTPSQIEDERRIAKASKRKFTNEEWQLCFEECEHCVEKKDGSRECARGCVVPAPLRAPRPIHPRECAHYQKRDEV